MDTPEMKILDEGAVTVSNGLYRRMAEIVTASRGVLADAQDRQHTDNQEVEYQCEWIIRQLQARLMDLDEYMKRD